MPELKEKFSAALTFFFARDKIVQAEFAVKNGMSETSLSDYKTGRKEGKETVRRKIVENFGISYESFLYLGELLLSGVPGEKALEQARRTTFGVGNVTIGPRIGPGQATIIPARRDANVEPAEMPKRGGMVPLISSVRAGLWTAAEGLEPGEAEEWVDAPAGVGARAFALRVVGDSMEPRFQEGEIIIVDPDIEAASGDYVVASLEREDATLKRYLREGGRDFLVPLNRRYDPIEMTGRDWKIIGRVMEKRQKF